VPWWPTSKLFVPWWSVGRITAPYLVRSRLGNIYLLLALVGIAVLYTTTEARVVRNYVIALWTIDITHIAVSVYGLGIERTLDVANWNPMTWGNIAVTVSSR
jgi:hypothetical protein